MKQRESDVEFIPISASEYIERHSLNIIRLILIVFFYKYIYYLRIR